MNTKYQESIELYGPMALFSFFGVISFFGFIPLWMLFPATMAGLTILLLLIKEDKKLKDDKP